MIFWQYKILSPAETIKGQRRFSCECSCWIIKEVLLMHLISGRIQSCGCLHKKIVTNHGMHKTRFYWIFKGLKHRTTSLHEDRKPYYEEKWIVCEWKDFQSFHDDMFQSYQEHCEKFWESKTTIDRIDSKWNYCKKNCRWATPKVQASNRAKKFTYVDKRKQ